MDHENDMCFHQLRNLTKLRNKLKSETVVTGYLWIPNDFKLLPYQNLRHYSK